MDNSYTKLTGLGHDFLLKRKVTILQLIYTPIYSLMPGRQVSMSADKQHLADKQHPNQRLRLWYAGRPRPEKGQGLAEYALIIALVGVAVILIMALTGTGIRDVYCKVLEGLGMRACVFVPTDWNRISGNWTTGDPVCGAIGEGRLFADGFSGENYTININSATLSQGNGYGVYFRATNQSAVNGYTFQYDPGYSGFIFRKWVNGSELSPPIAVKRVSGYDWAKPRDIKIVVNGDHFTAYVDNVPVLEATDSTYPSGGMGLRTWDNTKMCASGISIQEQ